MSGAPYTFRYIEAPIYWVPLPDDPPAVFLAGGITNCPRWHDDALVELRATGVDMVVLNPNRAHFPIHDPDAGKEQVWWEQHHLHLPETVTMMWFPESDASLTTQPIALFELGQALGENRRILVGADPGYPRARDVELMMGWNRPGEAVYSTLEDLVSATAAVVRAGGAGGQVSWQQRRAGRAFYVGADAHDDLTLWTGDPARPTPVAARHQLDDMDDLLWPLVTTVLAPTHLDGEQT